MNRAAGALGLAAFLAASAPGAQAPSILVDAASVRPALPNDLYGQTIEQTGDCLGGGIWAEMIDDRKFFHPVAEGESPWTILGEPRSVSMTTTKAFAGAHAPELELDGSSGPAGLTQGGLGVRSGARYAGRVILRGTSQAGPIDVSLVWGAGPSGRQTVSIRTFDERYRPYPVAFTAGASSDEARLEIAARGKGRILIGAVSLMPANNVAGFRADALAALRELNAPVYRWPGDASIGAYDWRGGIGDRDRRPPRRNPAGGQVESNDVGIHEFMTLCQLLGADPFLGVNNGPGMEASAAALVEYANGAAATPMGAQRALNGSQAPFGVRWWSAGREVRGASPPGPASIGAYRLDACGAGTPTRLKDALEVAAGIHESSRRGRAAPAASAAPAAHVIGALTTTKTAAALGAAGLVLKLYRAHFGPLPVGVAGEAGPLDVAAAWRDDRSALTLAIVNPTADPQAVGVELKGASFAPAATLRRIAGTDPMAYNEPGKLAAVKIEETVNVRIGGQLTLPPLSISIYEVRAR